MGHGVADQSVPKTRFCEKHYNYYAETKDRKKRSIETRDSNCSKRRKKVTEESDCCLDVTGGIQPPTTDRIGRRSENVERTERSGDPESLTGIGETVVELEHYKTKCFELSLELEKKKVECTTLQGKLAEVEEARKTAAAATDETEETPMDATESWRKMFSDLVESVESGFLVLENIVMRMDNRISTMEGCVESCISKMESLVLRSVKGSSILRCVQMSDTEKMESEARGWQNEVTESGEKQIDENNRSMPNAETSSGGRKDSHVYDVGSLHLSNGSENVEEGKGCGCLEEIPSQHGSSSQDHLEMSMNPFVNLVSDDDSVEILVEFEDYDGPTYSEGSLGALMDMMSMNYRNRNEDKEINWKFEADMLSSFEEDHELCMRAVCALYRQQISEDKISDKGLFHNSDALRCTTLAKFLMGQDCKGDLNKSVKELEIFDSKAVDDCKRLARIYSTQLFSIYQNGKDPFFPSCYNCQPWR